MSAKQSNVDWVKCYYDAFNRRDWEWVGAMLTPDVEWFYAARDERVKGVSAVLASFRSLLEAAPTAFVDLKSAHDAGGVVIAECGIRHASSAIVASKPGARAVTPATFCEVMELRGGRCARGTSYADSVRLMMDISVPSAAA
jgi:ketosteroid isomerase-like protein